MLAFLHYRHPGLSCHHLQNHPMNWKTLFRPFLNFLLGYLRDRFIKLSQMDGHPGLSADDFKVVVKKVGEIQAKYKNVDGMTRAKAVGTWVYDEFAGEITEYVVPILVSKAYEYADKTGVLPK